MAKIMGEQGLALTARTLSYISQKDDPSRVAELVDAVQMHLERRESDAAKVAARVLSTYLNEEDRLSEFMTGLDLWVRGQRVRAVPHFVRVLETDEVDKATCVASHLLGVSRYSEGDLLAATRYLERSIGALRQLNDVRGLVMTLTTYGRSQREKYRNDGVTEDLAAAVAALEEALHLAEDFPSVRPSVLRPLAQAYFDDKQIERAIEAIAAAVEEAPAGQERVDALTARAILFRDMGDDATYAESLDEALLEADIYDLQGSELARLLNVGAGRERRARNWTKAISLAQRSLAMGRKLEDIRHIAHSAHTLAAIYVDQIEGGEANRVDLEEVDSLLKESRKLLVQIKDLRGVAMIDNTISRRRAADRSTGSAAQHSADS
ncbi:hypothetical protein [Agromyces sp. H66]|uniref:hypothetical protein n=1 Tax=Agromyces sp. H66 TaxID=2529859 RepID=UPI0010AA718B|nr:hypothetical protein [Agromyces sp. H66]